MPLYSAGISCVNHRCNTHQTPYSASMPHFSFWPRIALLICLLGFKEGASSQELEQQRADFLKAEQALQQGKGQEADSLLSGLQGYPLYPYLLYQKALRELDSAPAISAFLSQYADTPYAAPLRQRWLERLAGRADWAGFLAAYRETHSLNLQCLKGLAQLSLGRSAEAFAAAAKIWAEEAAPPESCQRLFSAWRAMDASFGPAQVWKRYGLLLRKGDKAQADALQALLPAALQPQAALWRQVHETPRLLLSCTSLNPQAPAAAQIFAHGIDRLASSDPLLAQTVYALHRHRFALDAEEQIRLDRRTALALAAQRYPQTWAYLSALPAASADAGIRGWRVRAALMQRHWPGVLAAIAMLAPEEQSQAQWRYWRARALEALGDQPGAQGYYQLAAQERDFYGFSAADRIGRDYPLASQPQAITAAELQSLAETPVFQAISEWRALKREREARIEWLHHLNALKPQELIAAAKLAQQWGLDNLAINTAAKAGYWNDLELRFPLGMKPAVFNAAQGQQLDPALVYALIRRESAFDANAGSPAGARGLMQLMPGTGEMMAKKLGESLPSSTALLDPERNLRYGAAYFRGLLDKFNAHFALAAAAYNAGPGRVERWLPKDKAMPVDLWVETIPFSETRQYVAAVTAYATIYQARLNQSWRRLAHWLPEVQPGAKAEAKSDGILSLSYCE
jgi:soluble lytic murein transglycosylase